MSKTQMKKSKEVFETRGGDEEKEKTGPKTGAPGEKITRERGEFLEKREQIKKRETKNRFMEGMDTYKKEYGSAPFIIGGAKYKLNFENFEVNGKKTEDTGRLKKGLEKEEVKMEQVEGVFSVESKDGTRISQKIPADVIANGEVAGFIENAFSGGTYEKNEKAEREEKNMIAAAAEKKSESGEEKIKRQIGKITEAAEKTKGSVSVLEEKGGVTVNINYPDRQLRLTTTDGAVWSLSESRDNGKTITGKGSAGDPLDLLPKFGEANRE